MKKPNPAARRSQMMVARRAFLKLSNQEQDGWHERAEKELKAAGDKKTPTKEHALELFRASIHSA